MNNEPGQPVLYAIRLTDGRTFGPAGMDVIVQWSKEGRVPRNAMLVRAGGDDERPAMSEPMLAAILNAPPTVSTGLRPPQDDGVSVLIPYRNPPALTGYYIGIVSWLPLVGLLAGPMAIVLGVKGLRRCAKEPRVRGMAHAWIAIIMGSIGTLISLGCSLTIVMALLDDSR